MVMTRRPTADLPLAALTRTLITGPAGTGKSTLAQAIKRRYSLADTWEPAIVIDFDHIAVALGSTDDHDHPAHHRRMAKAAWIGAVRTISALPASVPVILIQAEPTPARLAWFQTTGWHIATAGPPDE